MPSIPTLALGALAVLASVPYASSKACPPLGPVLPAPRSVSKNNVVRSASAKLTAAFQSEFNNHINASAISVGVKSIHEDELLFSYHFTPPTQSGIGSTVIDDNTIYRVGSISKLFPVLAVLQNCKVSFNDPVVKYIPALRNATGASAISSVTWEDITIGALASHLAGLGTDSAFDLALIPNGPWAGMGLPEVPKGTGPTCSGLPGTRPCTAADLIRDMARRPPVYLPYTSPVYSNIGFAILGLVVEAATNRSFVDAAQNIFDSVGMTSSSFGGFPKHFSEKGFVPVGESTWNLTTGVYEAAGGMFSSTKDLLAFAEAILEHKVLSPQKTRQWLQPTTHTTSMGFSVGAPWEINRSDNLTVDGRTIDVYTKTGDLGLYHGVVALVPDYDIVASVLTGGPEVTVANTRITVLSAVLRALMPAIEQAGREEAAQAGYVGTFVDEARNSSLVLKVDRGPGLVIDSLTVEGFDVLNNFDSYSLTDAGSWTRASAKAEGRLYPSNRVARKGEAMETAWRAVIDSTTEEQRKELDDSIFYKDGSCRTWFGMDRAAYNFLSLLDFVVVTGGDGAVRAVRNPAFNVTLVASELS